jgi:hypothetical protein
MRGDVPAHEAIKRCTAARGGPDYGGIGARAGDPITGPGGKRQAVLLWEEDWLRAAPKPRQRRGFGEKAHSPNTCAGLHTSGSMPSCFPQHQVPCSASSLLCMRSLPPYSTNPNTTPVWARQRGTAWTTNAAIVAAATFRRMCSYDVNPKCTGAIGLPICGASCLSGSKGNLAGNTPNPINADKC